MIDGVKIIEILGDSNSVIKYSYKGYTFYCTDNVFKKLTKDEVEFEYNEAKKIYNELNETRIRLPSPTDADLSLFERWQSETGFDDEDEE